MKALWLFLIFVALIGFIVGIFWATIRLIIDFIKTANYTERKD
jgi:hypothetical protein